ncbi:GrpB family protein [Cronobacter sakazakii]|nr:GrpB family protein [Cronobacter sakazakii]MDT3609113.1 GrpB family protein [Cronobacter sakazakii]
MMAGRQIVLEPYNPAWPAQFAEEEKRVREVLGDTCRNMRR